MLRTPLSWLLAFVLLAAGFEATVLALNSDVYSAHGFVRSYLQALERKDADEALAFAGVDVPESESTALLVDLALGDIDGIRLLSDVATRDENVVRFAYHLDGDEQITEFHVDHDGTTLGLFQRWRFTVAPLARLDVSVVNDSRFTANGVQATAGAPMLVLAPGSYVVDDDTRFLSSASATVKATTIGETQQVRVEAEPTTAFDEAAQDAVAAFLDDCVTQTVLMPTGCPFGFTEANRIEGPPSWTMVDYPTVTLAPGATAGTWRATGVDGAVRLAITAKSLFDGSTSRVDERIDVAGSYLIALAPAGMITVLEGVA